MPKPTTATTTPESPSMRREWIEMQDAAIPQVPERPSPSMRREWIEIRREIGKSA